MKSSDQGEEIIISLRRATPDDAPALARVHVASWQAAYRGIVPDHFLDKLDVEGRTGRFRQSLSEGLQETYIAESDAEVLGFLTLGNCRDSDIDHTNTGEIWGIYLAPEQWRKGVGRFLTERAESMLASRGFSHAVLWVLERNSQARLFYEAMGFAVDGAIKEVKFGIPLTAVRYRKRLPDAKRTER